MMLSRLLLQNFRSYASADFSFSPKLTTIVGPNTAGKSNLLEAIFLLATGKSFRAESDLQLIKFDHDLTRVKGKTGDEEILEVLVATGNAAQGKNLLKRYLVNDTPKRRADFQGRLPALLFIPADLEIIVGSPSLRRRFLDDMLEQVDREYRLSLSLYIKGLRQRNALLEKNRESGIRSEKEFSYWDELIIKYGTYLHEKRSEFIQFANSTVKDIFDFTLVYNHSIISEERLMQYREAEIASALTLVGPHRDDFSVSLKSGKDLKFFGSRGQQRLVVLQLKLMQLTYMEEALGRRPLLLLDDIYSELDSSHIELVSDIIQKQQTILTTTHEEFLGSESLKNKQMIDLQKARAV